MKWIVLFILLALAADSRAQEKVDFSKLEYTYVEDMRLLEPDDLIGQTFAPRQVETLRHNTPQLLMPQSVLFRIEANQLFIERPLEEKNPVQVLDIRNITEVKEGFKINLSPRNAPTEEAYLVVIINAQQQAEGLVYKSSNSDPQELYYHFYMPPEIMQRDTAYFTSTREKDGTDIVNIWKESFFPYQRKTMLGPRFQQKQRIYPNDSLSFFFEEQLVVKGRREKLEHWLVFKQRPKPRFLKPQYSMPIYDALAEALDQAPETLRLEIKRVREIDVQHPDQSTVKGIELQLKHPEFDQLIIHSGPYGEVECIEFMGEEFWMRPVGLKKKTN